MSPCLLWAISLLKARGGFFLLGGKGLGMSAVCWSTMGGEGGIGATTSRGGMGGGVTAGLTAGGGVGAGTSLASVLL